MGFLSAIPSAVMAGSINDMFNMRCRVWILFTWVLAGSIGLGVGPIFSDAISRMVSSHVTNMLHDSRANSIFRHWIFYIAAVITGILFILCLPLSESRRSLLLEREVTKLRWTMPSSIFKTLNPDHTPDCKTLIRCTLICPLHLLFIEPIIILIAVMGSASCTV